jgi:HSP20 family protein
MPPAAQQSRAGEVGFRHRVLAPGLDQEGDRTMPMFADPFDALLGLQQALDSFRTSDWLGSGPGASGAYPLLNVFRKGDDYVVIAELPDVKKSDLDIQVKGNALRIAGSKTVEYGEKASIHRRERLAGRFDRTITLPIEVDAERVEAQYNHGILALLLPRTERDKPRSIKLS